MDLKPEKLYSPDFSLFFDIIAIPSKVFCISIDEFLDVYGIPHQFLLFDNILLQGLSLVLIHLVSNLRAHCFTVDFVIIYAPYHTHSHVNFTTQNIS